MDSAPVVSGYQTTKLSSEMKVLKFGGTSVGSVKSILSLKRIVEAEARKQSVVVVVSALGGITDQLIATSQMALRGDERYREEFDAMVDRHHQMIDTIITDPKKRENLFNTVDALFEQLKSIYYGVYLIHDLSRKTEDAIVSYGERLSSNIVAALVKNGRRMNARDFIRTERKNGKHVLDSELTNLLVPGVNDSEKQIVALCTWMADNNLQDVPLHFSRFFPRYRFTGVGPTPKATLLLARETAMHCGIKTVHLGNI